jgi:hypothetical protein
VRVLGINAVFHDPAAALVVDGVTVVAAEEERFSRRKHGREAPVPFSAWEMPAKAAAWCLEEAGLFPADLDAVACSYDPDLAPLGDLGGDITAEELGLGLVAMGSRGLEGMRRALMGSVSDSVVRHAHCPVLVVRVEKGSRHYLEGSDSAARRPWRGPERRPPRTGLNGSWEGRCAP